MQASKPQWDEELTSFLPREESTRAVNLASLRAEVAAVEVPPAEVDIEPVLSGSKAVASRLLSEVEAGEMTNFSPFSSTRIDADVVWPESPAEPAGSRYDRRRSEMVDVTRIESQPAGSSLQPTAAETFVSGLEVTAAPGDCECHHKAAAREDHQPLLCSNKRRSDQAQADLERLESPQKKLRQEESSSPDPEQQQQEDIATSDETIKAGEAETEAVTVTSVEDQAPAPADQSTEVHSTHQSTEGLIVDQVNTSQVKRSKESDSVKKEEEVITIDDEEDKSLSSSEQIPSEKPAESAVKVEEESININDNQTGDSRPSVEKASVENQVEIDSEEVEDLPMEVSEEDKVQSPQQSPVEILLRKVSEAAPAPSEPEETKVSQEVSIFQDLLMRKDPSACSPNDWELQFSSDQFAAFTWMEKALVVVLHLGEKIKPKKTRKSLGRVVHHWTISNIEFQPCHRDAGSPENIEQQIIEAGKSEFLSPLLDSLFLLILAQFCVLRKFPASNLSSQCPNTYSLSAFLTSVSTCVEPAITFAKALKAVSQRYYPCKVENNLVTLGKEI